MTTNDPILQVEPSALAHGFAAETNRLLIERTRFMICVGAPLYLAFWILDRTVFADQNLSLLALRLIGIAYFALALALSFTRIGQRAILPLSISVIYVGASIIAAMTVLGGGFSSPYYIGIMLVIFVAGSFMPWSPTTMVSFAVLVLATYIVPNMWFYGMQHSAPVMTAAFFLGGACVLATFASSAAAKRRRRDLALRLQLERANEDLQALDEAKTRFVANVSHELRTPLMLILGPLGELIQHTDDETQRVVFESMQCNAQRLLRQVNAILDVTKVEAGRVDLQLTPGNVGRQLAALIAAARPHAEARGLALSTEGLATLPDTIFDPEKIDIVVANLLSNAIKFTSSHGRVIVRASCDEKTLRFAVEDSGQGIAQEHQDHIFERFYQVDTSSARSHEGTGLGLALARELVRLHSGTITVSSQVGRGSVFTVEMPREPVPPPDRRRGQRRLEDRIATARQQTLASGGYSAHTHASYLLADIAPPALEHISGETQAMGDTSNAPSILVVEDNADLRSFIARGLATEYRVYTAADGMDGLDQARQMQPDLVLADVMMPRMDGHALCRALKADPMLAGVPLLLLTARAGTEAAIEGLEAGADDYLAKPFDLRELRARVHAHLRARRLERRLDERENRLLTIGGMTAAIAHDLKNPLTAITILGDMITRHVQMGNDKDAIFQDLATLSGETERLRRMLMELLDFARAGVMELQRRAVPVRDFLETIMEQPQRMLRELGVDLVMDLTGVTETKAPIDCERLHRVIENLVTNAREAAVGRHNDGTHNPCVWLRASVSDHQLLIRIADNGPGISKDIAAKLFQPFASINKPRGVGLGLVMARSLARAHDGEVEVEPKAPEGGAAFTLRLPCPNGSPVVD